MPILKKIIGHLLIKMRVLNLSDVIVGKREPFEWVRNKRKANRSCGLEYTIVKGIIQPAKKMQSSCQCRINCEFSVNENEREMIVSEFWKLCDINPRRELIDKLLIVETNKNHNSRRK